MLVQRTKAPLIPDVSFDPVALLPLLVSLGLRILAIPASHEKVCVLLIDCIISEM